ncbi:hypothetical protein A3709_19215 [Halioglobus sp. HI00S01]|uniref:hypothetical protein n=1 Tax=Halioglobus sp. HI00S01 TaxID=1822214 RepID=UPI0007C36D2B|nr:hypothetical protein [Halioglobus sp. HI00S01]KZX57754.1 hypothetical protein A3709_19215 [Halioglobus sp. HI00S01]
MTSNTDTALVIASELMVKGDVSYFDPDLREAIDQAATAYDAGYDALSQEEQDANEACFDNDIVPVLMEHFPVGSEMDDTMITTVVRQMVLGETVDTSLMALRKTWEKGCETVCELGDKDTCFIVIVRAEDDWEHKVLRYFCINGEWAVSQDAKGCTADNVLADIPRYLNNLTAI